MSITVQLDLPEGILNEAKAKGLLQSAALSGLLEREMARQKACEDFGAVLKQLHSVSGDEMTEEEIQAEVDAVRAKRRARREGNR